MEGGEIVTIVTFWSLKKQWIVALVVLMLFASTLPLSAGSSAKPSCPTAGKTVGIHYVDSDPKSAAVGTTVTTLIAVRYPDESPVTLSPQTISFRWVGAAGEKIVENAPVVGQAPGDYRYEQKVGDDFPTGTVTIFVVACSCSDGQGNYGPITDVSSDSSERLEDNSTIEIGATMQQPAAQDLLVAYGVPIVIAIVVVLAVLLVLRRRRKKT